MSIEATHFAFAWAACLAATMTALMSLLGSLLPFWQVASTCLSVSGEARPRWLGSGHTPTYFVGGVEVRQDAARARKMVAGHPPAARSLLTRATARNQQQVNAQWADMPCISHAIL